MTKLSLKNRNQKLSLFFVGAFALASSVFAAGRTATIESTAMLLALDQQPMAELADERFNRVVKMIQSDLTAISEKVLTEEGANQFWSTLPWVAGELLIKFRKDFTVNPKMVDGVLQFGDPGLDSLAKQYELTKIEHSFLNWYKATISKKVNPLRAGAEFKELPVLLYAEPNSYGFLRRSRGIHLLSTRRARTYVLHVGWGDCPAGCIYENRLYLELSGYDAQTQLNIIGRVGAPLDSELEKKLFR